MKSGEYEIARDAFERSIDLHPSPGAYLNLALSEEKLGHRSKALEHLATMVALVDIDDERRDFALAKIIELRAQEPSASPRPEPSPVKPDSGAPAKSPENAEATKVVLTAPVIAWPQPKWFPVPERVEPNQSGWAFALAGAGAAAVGVGAATGIAALLKKSEALTHCDAKFCDPRGLALADDARWYATVSTGAFVGGVLSLGVASYFIVSGLKPKAISVGVVPAPGHAQLLVEGAL